MFFDAQLVEDIIGLAAQRANPEDAVEALVISLTTLSAEAGVPVEHITDRLKRTRLRIDSAKVWN